MKTHLDSVAAGIQQTLRILKSDIQEFNQMATNNASKKGNLTAIIASTKERIAKINTDDLIKEGEDSVDNPYFFFSPQQKKELKVLSPYYIETATCNLGEHRCFWSNELKFDSNRKIVSRTIESHFCGGIAGTIIAFVKSKIKHGKQIEMAQKEVLNLNAELARVDAQLINFESNVMKKDSQIEQFVKRAQQAGIVSGKLHSDKMPLEEYITTRPLFSMGDNAGVLVQTYCKLMNLNYDLLDIQ